jgi:hypothetical protein
MRAPSSTGWSTGESVSSGEDASDEQATSRAVSKRQRIRAPGKAGDQKMAARAESG